MAYKKWSGRGDLNSRPLAPQASALAGLRYAPNHWKTHHTTSPFCFNHEDEEISACAMLLCLARLECKERQQKQSVVAQSHRQYSPPSFCHRNGNRCSLRQPRPIRPTHKGTHPEASTGPQSFWVSNESPTMTRGICSPPVALNPAWTSRPFPAGLATRTAAHSPFSMARGKTSKKEVLNVSPFRRRKVANQC